MTQSSGRGTCTSRGALYADLTVHYLPSKVSMSLECINILFRARSFSYNEAQTFIASATLADDSLNARGQSCRGYKVSKYAFRCVMSEGRKRFYSLHLSAADSPPGR